jgi:1,4-alpha-glucan branching enzyme
MCRLGDSGVFELFVPGVCERAHYKFELKTRENALRLKSDPFAFSTERPPASASRVFRSRHVWRDDTWMAQRASRDPRREPLAVYEVHIGSWRRVAGEEVGYAELAEPLIAHARRFGFTHIELMPIAEHPFEGSWGYQVSAYYAPTARYGTPDDLRAFVDACHRSELGVILDWVPAHFPRDDFALRRFDGHPIYEYEDPRLGEHPHWGTLVFDYGRGEVRSFLLANALYWLQEFHIDALRVDAVASMLYRDYGRAEGEWLPNAQGGRENLEAVSFLRELNRAVGEQCRGCFTIAEESTPWPGVTKAVDEGGLGFTFKWNLGWMHDTLRYFSEDPIHRRWHQDQLTFASHYEHSESYMMPLSHDEVVHGKGSLLSRMPGDDWQRFANLRCLFAYQFTRPGKKLLFMGSELAPETEWDHRRSLDWNLFDDPRRAALTRFLECLGALYRSHPCLWQSDSSPDGFRWIDCNDRTQSVLAYLRRFFEDELVIVLNLTPVPRTDYRIGAPRAGVWVERLCSDDPSFGGSGYPRSERTRSERVAVHGQPSSLRLQIPPLSALVLECDAD